MGMELPLTAIRQQIASGIDVLIHLERGKDKKRRVVEISEVLDVKNGVIRLNKLYEYKNGHGLIKQGELKKRDKLFDGKE
jgi:pilus assembly protein CpaF